MARVSGLSRPTVYAGVRELDDPPDPGGRIRRPGGGPKRLTERDPGLLQALDELVDPDTRGDPESPCGGRANRPASSPTPLPGKGSRSPTTPSGGCSSSSAYTLQRTLKTEEGAQHPDRERSSGMPTSRPGSISPPASRS